jgi:RNA polymerase subunit RPABC4/transcription elongation factor Spt4
LIPLLVSWPGGSIEATLRLVALLLIAYGLVLWLSAVVWVFRDVKNRTADPMSQLVAVLLVALFNVPGLMVYLVIRPQSTLADSYERSLEAEAILHELQLAANSCQSCRRPIEDDFIICPHCRTVLREGCRNCGKPVRTNWAVCPYCATERAPRTPTASAASVEQTQASRRRAASQSAEPAAPGTTATRPPVAGQR